MSKSKICFRLTQTENTYKLISKNKRATINDSLWKIIAHDKVFNFFTKRPFFTKKNAIQ